MVFIQPQSDRANYFIDLLNLREENEIKPTAGEVIDIKAGSGKNNPTDILTLIAPGIYGKFTETEKQVKLKLYDPLTDGPLSKKIDGGRRPERAGTRRLPAKQSGFTKGTIIMMVALRDNSRPLYRADIFKLVTARSAPISRRHAAAATLTRSSHSWISIKTRNTC